MFSLEKIVCENIWKLQAYSSARDEFSGKEGVFLDANENPFGELNRYPDPQQKALKKKLSSLKSVSESQIFLGNGSDEVIDLVFRIFCESGKDKVLTFTPTYGMYEVSASINNVEVVQASLTSAFQIDFEQLSELIKDDGIKLLFICSPNNPTGNNIDQIDRILDIFNGVVIIDEAYIDFSTADSWAGKVKDYPNLIVIQTFSKAWGLAGARVGIAYANTEIITLLNKVKPPYNISTLNQEAALNALNNVEVFEEQKTTILEQRNWLKNQLQMLTLIKKIHPSDSNFLLIEIDNADFIYNELVKQKVITRNRNNVVRNCIRITVGSEEENQTLIEALKNL